MTQANLFDEQNNVFNKQHNLKFIDLFAGIGGFHLALHNVGAECVFASEIDKYARETYEKNFAPISKNLFLNNLFNDDIRNIPTESIPNFDILCAGFPCQPFSQAGLKLGFNDGNKSERGNLFFVIADILEAKRPRSFILENVQHLIKHENGETFQTIKNTIIELGYSFYYQVLKASDYGLPQHRPRIFMVGFLDDHLNNFCFPSKQKLAYSMDDIFNGKCNKKIGFTLRVGGKGSGIEDRRNWDCYLVNNEKVRIGINEAKKMQGFPKNFEFPVSKTQAMKQLGNSVAISVVEAVAKQVINYNLKLFNMGSIMLQEQRFNKGEWTELLIILKLIVEQSIQLYDSKLETYQNKIFRVLTIHGNNNTIVQLRKNSIEVFNNKNLIYSELIINIITKNNIDNILNQIIQNTGTFKLIDVPQNIELNILPNLPIKSQSTNKTDITLDIENADTIGAFTSSFSIKSQLGGYPTLINASSGTNFIYKINNCQLNNERMQEINIIATRGKIKDRISKIKSLNGNLEFIATEKSTMAQNLNLIDSNLTDYVAEILLNYYSGAERMIESLISSNSLIFTELKTRKYKIKKFLSAFALGAFPSKLWSGNEESNGFIILKKDGNMGALHILYRNELEDYILQNSFLDTPSSTRNRFGTIYKEHNDYFIKLNLQIRLAD
jgi:DNA (cytosine-5)-methyltransferase 1